MLFSNPDYPVFLIAVFFLYAVSRLGGTTGRIGRIAVMVLLGDLVFLLVAKQPDALWDPLGNLLYRLTADTIPDRPIAWPWATLAWHWVVGFAVLGGALVAGMRGGAWMASERGQRWIARGMVAAIAAVGALVAITWHLGTLDQASEY